MIVAAQEKKKTHFSSFSCKIFYNSKGYLVMENKKNRSSKTNKLKEKLDWKELVENGLEELRLNIENDYNE